MHWSSKSCSAPQAPGRVSGAWDRAGIVLSGLCVVHCLLLPVALIALPHAGHLGGFAEVAHPLFAVLLLPVTVQALRDRCPHHRLQATAARWLLLAGLGCVWMALPAHLLVGHEVETLLTVTGSLSLIAGHGQRWRQAARSDRPESETRRDSMQGEILLRPLTTADAPLVARSLTRLSDHARYLHFGSMHPHRNEALLDSLCAVDGHRHVAWAAVHEGDLVGVCRYVQLCDEPATAELAAFVLDGYQHRGIGRLLLRAMAETARRQRIRAFVCNVLPENRTVLQAVKRWSTGLDVRDGMVQVRVATDRLLEALADVRSFSFASREPVPC